MIVARENNLAEVARAAWEAKRRGARTIDVLIEARYDAILTQKIRLWRDMIGTLVGRRHAEPDRPPNPDIIQPQAIAFQVVRVNVIDVIELARQHPEDLVAGLSK